MRLTLTMLIRIYFFDWHTEQRLTVRTINGQFQYDVCGHYSNYQCEAC